MQNKTYLKTPNLPTKSVKTMLADSRISADAMQEFKRMGIRVLFSATASVLQKPVSGHPDMTLHHLDDRVFCCPPQLKTYYQNLLPDAEILAGKTELSRNYPGDIAYNVGRVGRYAFHNLKYTEPQICAYYEKIGVNLIHVPQGYSKCSICVISKNAIITTDTKIAAAADLHGIDVLYIDNASIQLTGMSCGLIGGCTGLAAPDKLLVNGNINLHPEHMRIFEFCRKYHVEIHSLHSGVLEDIGSLIPLFE